MGLTALVDSIYLSTVGSANVRYRQIPTAAAGIAIADDAAWDQIVDNTVITTVHWLASLNIGTTAAAGADTEEVIGLGIGGANGATVAAATLLVEIDFIYNSITAVGEYPMPFCFLPVPIQVPALTRYAGVISSSITGGLAITLGFDIMTGLGA